MSIVVWDSGPMLVSVARGYCDRCPRPAEPVVCVQIILHVCRVSLCRTCFSIMTWEAGNAVGRLSSEHAQ